VGIHFEASPTASSSGLILQLLTSIQPDHFLISNSILLYFFPSSPGQQRDLNISRDLSSLSIKSFIAANASEIAMISIIFFFAAFYLERFCPHPSHCPHHQLQKMHLADCCVLFGYIWMRADN
jgi:hypothetical protein